ncbi:MAG: branched-chain amino acid ABC transporter substrate-binding protein, partial [Betaproteobacteria bacterium]
MSAGAPSGEIALEGGARAPRSRRDARILVVCAIVALLLVAAGPWVLPMYMVNSLIRAFLYAAVALTVDILWGYTGILTFGQSAFFGIGAYAVGLMFTHVGFGPGYATLAFFGAVVAAMLAAVIVGGLAFYHGASPLYGSVVTLVLPIVVSQILYSGGNFTGSSSGLSGFESFDVSIETWFWIAGAFLVALTSV